MKKKVLSFIIVLFLFCGISYSQGYDTASVNKVKPIKKWALQFEIGYNFDIRSFQNLAFSMKYSFTPVTSIRFGPGYSFESEDIDNTTVTEQVGKTHNENYDLSFSTELLFYVNPKSSLKFYLGFGPKIFYSFDHSERLNEVLDKGINELKGFGGGANLIIGGEWFISNLISLLAEYNTSVTYQSTDAESYTITSENFTINKSKSSIKNWTIRPDDARLGISLHF